MHVNLGNARNGSSIPGVAFALLAVPWLAAQTGNDMSHFEVVSIRLNQVLPPDPHPCTGGPGTQSPTLWRCNSVAYAGLIGPAFGLETYQYHYQTTQLKVDTYTVSARLPQGATEEQFRAMRRNMLEERFGLKWHWKESEATVYRLVRDPGGVKLRESAPDAAPAVTEYGTLPKGTKLGKDRYPVWPEGLPGLVQMANHNRWKSSNVATADIAHVLRYELKTDVIDETGLTGHYDVDLRWETPPIEYFASAPPYEGPEAKTEFRTKLGLRLEPVKGKIKSFVVDHIERIPTDN